MSLTVNIRRLLHLTAILIIGSSDWATAGEMREDFSGDSGLWRFSTRGGGNGKHTIHDGRLEFSTQGGATHNDSATHYWKAPVGTYGNSWEVQADVFLGGFRLGKDDPYAGLALLVANEKRPLKSFIRMQLRKGDRNRAFNADGYRGRKHLGSKWADTNSETATLSIRFDAKSKVLTASYDADGPEAAEAFVDLFSINIENGPGSWQMKTQDAFEFSIVSQSTQSNVSLGDMCFDNVVVRSPIP